MMDTEHPQVTVTVGDRSAEVDAGVADLIEQLWLADIDTVLSCEDNPAGMVWVQFDTAVGAENFLNVVARYEGEPGSLYRRASDAWQPVSDEPAWANWEYDVSLSDLALDEEVDAAGEVTRLHHPGRPDFVFAVSVRFPRSDYAVVCRRLRDYNRRRATQCVCPLCDDPPTDS
ncbi:MAG: hypothetical protein JNM56_12970 [Planctomycetia bacterium]|nr:hypothetical protein [Planctomycetia bacterium]